MRQGRRIGTIAAALVLCVFLGGCSAMKFIATGDEFKQICEDNGLAVTDIRAQAQELGEVDEDALIDAYTVTDEDEGVTVYYLRFSDRKASDAFFGDVAGRMDGTEVREANYAAVSETVGEMSRRIYQEDGRVLYAEGNADAIDGLIAQLTSGFEKDEVSEAPAE